jgi:mannose-6-phosphate isomerase-like protein (cupin superfamily)
VVLGGEATLDDGIETHAVRVGDIVVIPAGQPHGFTNTGESPSKADAPSLKTENRVDGIVDKTKVRAHGGLGGE